MLSTLMEDNINQYTATYDETKVYVNCYIENII